MTVKESSEWRKAAISLNKTIIDAMRQLDTSALRLLLVVDNQDKLLGTISDGDIRRYILKSASLDAPLGQVMKKKPITASVLETKQQLLDKMHEKGVLQLPILNEIGQVIGLETLDHLSTTEKYENRVILMAGGLGRRLMPLTEDCPKPLLPIGEKPIIETLLERFMDSGFHHFYISLNYKGSQIKEYFGDGAKWGADIQYLEEDEKLGTAGALSLLKEKQSQPFFVVNGDIMTTVNFNHLLDFHNDMGSSATMCVREHVMTVPYGVVQAESGYLHKIQEKPSHRFHVNAGIYVFSPNVLKHLNYGESCDMVTFFKRLMSDDEACVAFPLHEYWRDVGQHQDYELANQEYREVFGV